MATPSFIALVSGDSTEPIYLLKLEEKKMAEKEEHDDFGHIISPGEFFIRGRYLKKERSRSTRCYKFSILSGDAICTPDEVFELFVDVSDDLTIEKETFNALLLKAEAF